MFRALAEKGVQGGQRRGVARNPPTDQLTNSLHRPLPARFDPGWTRTRRRTRTGRCKLLFHSTHKLFHSTHKSSLLFHWTHKLSLDALDLQALARRRERRRAEIPRVKEAKGQEPTRRRQSADKAQSETEPRCARLDKQFITGTNN